VLEAACWKLKTARWVTSGETSTSRAEDVGLSFPTQNGVVSFEFWVKGKGGDGLTERDERFAVGTRLSRDASAVHHNPNPEAPF
jgi:hypothetical protein